MDLSRVLKGSNPVPQSHNALNDFYQSRILEAVRKGDQLPFVWPYNSFGIYIMLAYLLLPPTSSKTIRYLFYPVFAFFSYSSWEAITKTKSASIPVTYFIGIGYSWAVLWTASRMIFTDYRVARRIEKLTSTSDMKALAPEQDAVATSIQNQGTPLRRRVDGSSKVRDVASSLVRPSAQLEDTSYYWQTLPTKFLDRCDFIVDLIFAMRGPGWAHQARSIPGPPDHIASQLKPPPPSTKPVVRDYKDRPSLVRANVIRVIKFYIYLDIIKTMMTHDLYFLGFTEPTPPAPAFLPSLIRNSLVLTQWYRIILAMLTVRIALGMIFSLSPIFFSGVLGTRFMGLRAEHWYYSDFGGDWRFLLSDGIAGWWGSWWHQIFRLGFEAPSTWACEKLSLSRRSMSAKIIALLVAFTFSGLIHALASICMVSETDPWSGSFLFFILQPLGIIIESAVGHGFRAIGITQKTPQGIRKIITVLWLATWAYYTGPIVVDDFSRSRIWLFEPVPFSFAKMLGFGEENDHWWRWRGRNLFWYTGDVWWKSGIAF